MISQPKEHVHAHTDTKMIGATAIQTVKIKKKLYHIQSRGMGYGLKFIKKQTTFLKMNIMSYFNPLYFIIFSYILIKTNEY